MLFKRYAPSARRAVYFAREAALRGGDPSIDSSHLLRGLLVEDTSQSKAILQLRQLLGNSVEIGQFEGKTSSGDIPLVSESKRILAYAAEEAARLGSYWIDAEHLVLGILREDSCMAAVMLKEAGIRIEQLREIVAQKEHSHVPHRTVPWWWPLEKPLTRLGRPMGLLYLAALVFLIELVGSRYCGSRLR